MNLADLLLGRPLATEDEKAQRIGPARGIPIFGLDALSSAAYGPEAAPTVPPENLEMSEHVGLILPS